MDGSNGGDAITLPAHGWKPRSYQAGLWLALQEGKKRAIAICHRRWGKDEIALNIAAWKLTEKVGGWWHCLPEYAQARKAIWTQVNPHTGRRRIDEAFPPELRRRTNDQEMFIELVNGSTFQVIGSDSYNRLVGSSPVGISFSEYALANPAAWAYFAPILDENDGTAVFITTPRGKNHAYKTYKMALDDPDNWYACLQGVNETGYPLERVERQRREYVGIFGQDAGDALIEQEYNVSFEAAILGAVYGKEIASLRRAGRVYNFKIEPTLPVHRSWDFGYSDSMAIWFFQMVGSQIRYVDYIEGSFQKISDYADQIHKKRYPKGTRDNPACDFVPHDAKVHELGTGKTRVELMIAAKLNPVLVPLHHIEDRFSASRETLKRSYFHAGRCGEALETLAAYQYEFDTDALVFKRQPKHNYASHNADSYGISAMAYVAPPLLDKPTPGRILQIDAPGVTIQNGVPQITIDDLWRQHEADSRNDRKLQRRQI